MGDRTLLSVNRTMSRGTTWTTRLTQDEHGGLSWTGESGTWPLPEADVAAAISTVPALREVRPGEISRFDLGPDLGLTKYQLAALLRVADPTVVDEESLLPADVYADHVEDALMSVRQAGLVMDRVIYLDGQRWAAVALSEGPDGGTWPDGADWEGREVAIVPLDEDGPLTETTWIGVTFCINEVWTMRLAAVGDDLAVSIRDYFESVKAISWMRRSGIDRDARLVTQWLDTLDIGDANFPWMLEQTLADESRQFSFSYLTAMGDDDPDGDSTEFEMDATGLPSGIAGRVLSRHDPGVEAWAPRDTEVPS